MPPIDIIVIIAVALAFVGAIWYRVKKKKNGSHCGGSCGDCDKCQMDCSGNNKGE